MKRLNLRENDAFIICFEGFAIQEETDYSIGRSERKRI
jgi:hypothetical protein